MDKDGPSDGFNVLGIKVEGFNVGLEMVAKLLICCLEFVSIFKSFDLLIVFCRDRCFSKPFEGAELSEDEYP